MEKALTEHFCSLLQFSCTAGALKQLYITRDTLLPLEFLVTEQMMLQRCTKQL